MDTSSKECACSEPTCSHDVWLAVHGLMQDGQARTRREIRKAVRDLMSASVDDMDIAVWVGAGIGFGLVDGWLERVGDDGFRAVSIDQILNRMADRLRERPDLWEEFGIKRREEPI